MKKRNYQISRFFSYFAIKFSIKLHKFFRKQKKPRKAFGNKRWLQGLLSHQFKQRRFETFSPAVLGHKVPVKRMRRS